MPQLGKKYTCYSCHTKFYDLGKPVPLCPKCGADQRDAEEAPVVSSGRGRSRAAAVVVEPEPIEDSDLESEAEPVAPAVVDGEEEEEIIPGADEREEEADDDEEEEF